MSGEAPESGALSLSCGWRVGQRCWGGGSVGASGVRCQACVLVSGKDAESVFVKAKEEDRHPTTERRPSSPAGTPHLRPTQRANQGCSLSPGCPPRLAVGTCLGQRGVPLDPVRGTQVATTWDPTTSPSHMQPHGPEHQEPRQAQAPLQCHPTSATAPRRQGTWVPRTRWLCCHTCSEGPEDTHCPFLTRHSHSDGPGSLSAGSAQSTLSPVPRPRGREPGGVEPHTRRHGSPGRAMG